MLPKLTCTSCLQAYLASSSDEEKPADGAAKYKALLGKAALPGKQRTGAKAWGGPSLSQPPSESAALRSGYLQAYLASSSDEEKPAGGAAKYKALLDKAALPGKQRTGGKAWGAPEPDSNAGSSGADDADAAAADQASLFALLST